MFKRITFLMVCLAIYSLYADEMDQTSKMPSQIGRYQLRVAADKYHKYIYVIDTELGIVWERQNGGWEAFPPIPSQEWNELTTQR